MPQTAVLVTDRIAVRLSGTVLGAKTLTAYFNDARIGQVTTTFSSGLQGSTGPTGPASGLNSYGYIYNTSARTIAAESPILYDSSGILDGILHSPGTASITVTNTGIYNVLFSVSGSTANQFGVFVNGSSIPESVYGSGAVTQQNNGMVKLSLSANDIITVVNHTSAGPISLLSTIGGTVATVNASVIVDQIR